MLGQTLIDGCLDTDVNGRGNGNAGKKTDEGEEAHIDGIQDGHDDADGNEENDAQQEVGKKDGALVARRVKC